MRPRLFFAISRRATLQRFAVRCAAEIAVAARQPVFLHQARRTPGFCGDSEDYRSRLAGGVGIASPAGGRKLEDLLALDLYVGVTGWINDERRGAQLRAAVPHVPRDRLMVETDAPYLLPRESAAAARSRRNEPCFLPHIARSVAPCRGESPGKRGGRATRNAVVFFGLDAP